MLGRVSPNGEGLLACVRACCLLLAATCTHLINCGYALRGVCSRLSLLRRVELFGNPMQSDPTYPDVLLKAQPSLVEFDHMRQQVGELAAGIVGGAISRRTVGEAIDAVANAALAQHALNLERHRAAHASLLSTLQAQQEEAARSAPKRMVCTSWTTFCFPRNPGAFSADISSRCFVAQGPGGVQGHYVQGRGRLP